MKDFDSIGVGFVSNAPRSPIGAKWSKRSALWVKVVCSLGQRGQVDDEKQQKARRLLEKGSDKVAYDILKRLADGPRRPAELRAALGIASANFFTARYLTLLAKSGYIAVAGGEKNRYLPGKQYRILRKGKAVICA